jgi:hypothetical protein
MAADGPGEASRGNFSQAVFTSYCKMCRAYERARFRCTAVLLKNEQIPWENKRLCYFRDGVASLIQ